MNKHQEIIEEYKKNLKKDRFSRNQVIAIEQRIRKESPQVCEKCGSEKNLTLDHIVPKNILMSMGIDPTTEVVDENYQILCNMCNVFKSARLDFSNKKTKQILLKLLNNI